MDTNANFSPHSLLPAPEPCTENPPADYFYDNVAKHLIRDTVRVMMNGLPIDLSRVIELEASLDNTLQQVESTLTNNPYIQAYLKQRHANEIIAHKELWQSRCKPSSEFLRPFDPKKLEHRSYFMHVFSLAQGIDPPTDLLPTGIPKWTANQVKKFATTRPLLTKLLANSLPASNSYIIEAMELLAQHKADLYNRSRLEQVNNPQVGLPTFNPNSPNQLRELFTMLGYESEKISKQTGEPSWERKQIERVLAETDDPLVKEICQALIDFSFGNIIKTNFVPAFYKYTVDGKLYGQYKLFGAKS